MKVLWFEVTVPQRYKDDGAPIGGWQDSLEELVRQEQGVELFIAFEGKEGDAEKTAGGVTYIPIVPKLTFWQRKKSLYTNEVIRDVLVPLAVDVVERVKPDVIHVFGSEWCWGQVQQHTDVPVVIHMQGSIPPYYNARMPPMYSDSDLYSRWNIKKNIHVWLANRKYATWVSQEEKTLQCVSSYMGRTKWDEGIVKLYNPTADYYYCSEALRSVFYEGGVWSLPQNKEFTIVSTGISSFWKGCDTILRTARILKQRGFDFKWLLCGNMPQKDIIESKEGTSFAENNVEILGFQSAGQLKDLLLKADLYVHLAYIDNSPNSVCEAQILGVPVIATYVGGIPSLITDGEDGLLVAANDPFTTANDILELAADDARRLMLGKNARKKAVKRHDRKVIMRDLMNCYKSLLG